MRWIKFGSVFALLALNMIGTIGRSEDVTVKENIVYGKGGETQLKLDLARPSGDGPFPAIVFIHGGGFYQGSGQAYNEAIREAASGDDLINHPVAIAFTSKLNSLCRLSLSREAAAFDALDRLQQGDAVEYEVIPI